MVQSKAKTVEDYLNELPDDRRATITALREIILDNIPRGYVETMNWGVISYEIPLETYPDTYNGKPLSYVALASQKQHMAVYMHGVYADPKQLKILTDAFKDMGVKPNMGKSCIRFTKLEKIPLDTILELIRDFPPEDYIKCYERIKKK